MQVYQRQICQIYGCDFVPPAPQSILGVALATIDRRPLHGVRLTPTESSNGWYLFGGEWSDDADFYQPLHIEHLEVHCPLALAFLGLPPGWRFIADDHGYRDCWFQPHS